MNIQQNTGGIDIVTAGAGSGKTHRITEEIVEAIAAGHPAGSLLVTSFTRRAAAELAERVQAALAARGQAEAALTLPDALIGTVNSVCGRLLGEFALEAGLSPDLAVLEEGAAATGFTTAIGGAAAQFETEIGPLAERLGLAEWTALVTNIATAARANRIGPNELLAEGVRGSVAGLNALLDSAPAEQGPILDAALRREMDLLRAATRDWNVEKERKNSWQALETVRQIAALFHPEQGRMLGWADWAKLAKLAPAKARQPDFAALIEAAAAHDRHPRLAADMAAMILLCYQAAARAMTLYQDQKRAAGVIDFIDQEALLLGLLESNPAVQTEIAARGYLMFVDEFQDTSPLQLALFLKLAALARRTTWVGDPKQAIFGFRGADAGLMDTVVRQLAPAEDAAHILGTSRRSRPDLVGFVNELAVPAFAAQGMGEARVRLSAHRQDQPGLGAPLVGWRLPKLPVRAQPPALAATLAAALAQPGGLMVAARAGGAPRPARPGDVAILCRSNKMVAEISQALAAVGLRAAAPRQGLLECPEVRLALACLRRLADGADTLAAAEITHLCDPLGAGGWLAERLAARRAGGEGFESEPRVAALDAAAADAADLPPAAALAEALAVAGIRRILAAWPDPAQRLANLEALLAAAIAYQDWARQAGRAATAGGLAPWLAARQPPPDQPPAFGPDAVSVLTYHRAKGLEWPVVVMTQLGQDHAPSAFTVSVAAPPGPIDLRAPLAGRWVRFWPWPYGAQRAQIPLAAREATCPEYLQVADAEAAEAVRLGYVGLTRARDVLILALEPGAPAWAEKFAPGLAASIAALPAGSGVLSLGAAFMPVEVADLAAAPEPTPPPRGMVRTDAWPDGPPPSQRPARLTPSAQPAAPEESGPPLRLVRLGARLAQGGRASRAALGEALHGFLAADDPARPLATRLAQARDILAAWELGPALSAESCVLAADRLWGFIAAQWPGATMLREWPVQQRRPDGVELHGRIDLLLRTAQGLVVVDHKTFPGTDVARRVRGQMPQLAHYATALEAAGAGRVSALVVHLPVLGLAVLRAHPVG